MPEVTVSILTFLRDEMIFKCAKNIERNVTVPFRLEIIDHGRPTAEKSKFYDNLRRKNYDVHELPFDSGHGVRHDLFLKCETPYYLCIADDMFPRRGSIKTLLDLMKELSDFNVRIVAPVLWETDRYRYLTKRFTLKNNVFHVTNVCRHSKNFDGVGFEKSENGIQYIMTNITSEAALYDIRIRGKVNWDPRFKMSTHNDIFLQLAQTEWKVVTTPDAVFDHTPWEEGEYKRYKRNPQRIKEDKHKLEEKWHIKAVK